MAAVPAQAAAIGSCINPRMIRRRPRMDGASQPYPGPPRYRAERAIAWEVLGHGRHAAKPGRSTPAPFRPLNPSARSRLQDTPVIYVGTLSSKTSYLSGFNFSG